MPHSLRRTRRRYNDPSLVNFQNTLYQVNGNDQLFQQSPLVTAPCWEQLTEIDRSINAEQSSVLQHSRNSQVLEGMHHHHQIQYVAVPRPWASQNLALISVVNNPILNVTPSSSRRASSTPMLTNEHQSPLAVSSPSFPNTASSSGASHGEANQLTEARLEQHRSRQSPANPLRRFMGEAARVGPFNVIGWIRRDEQIDAEYEDDEDCKWDEDFEMHAEHDDQRRALH